MTDTQDNNFNKINQKDRNYKCTLRKKKYRKRLTVLDITGSSDNEKTNRHDRNTICHKCKGYGHTKK